jgi:DNA-directed RNA polymerase specialized sigma24 family protein
MPPALKEILLLAYFQRLSYAQIAEDLEIPFGNRQVPIARGGRHLLEALDGQARLGWKQ